MGLGDDIMATAVAKIEKEKYPDRQIVIGDFEKKLGYESIIYKNNPYITDQKDLDKNKIVHFVNIHKNNRPYINLEKTNSKNYVWNENFKILVGQIFFSKTEIDISKKIIENAKLFWNKKNKKNFKGIIFIESSSTKFSEKAYFYKQKNLDWGYDNWLKLVKELSQDFLFIQSVHKETVKLPNIFYCETDFRAASSVINECDLYIGPHGGFAHAAAALGKKAVIYFGGWVSPNILGYDFHKNIFVDIDGSPCGAKGYECQHCIECKKLITIDLMTKFINKEIIR